MKGIISVILMLLLLALPACDTGFKTQTYSTAPSVISDELLAAGLTTDTVAELMAENPQAKVRPLSKDTFAFIGLTRRQILEASPTTIVETNRFIKLQRRQSLINRTTLLANAFNSPASRPFSPQNCTNDSLMIAPKITIKDANDQTPSIFNVNDKLKLLFEKPINKSLVAWYIIPPEGSKLKIDFVHQNNINFSPDMPGSYGIALFFKRRDHCNVRIVEIVATSNQPYNPTYSLNDTAALDKLAMKNFKQIAITKAGLAQNLVTNKTSKVVVAVLDSGVNYNHPALKKSIWTNPDEIPNDEIDNDKNGYVDDVVGYDFQNNDSRPMDDIGHGSHIAGLIAGAFMGTGNIPNVKLMILKGSSENGIHLAAMLQGLNYAIDNGAHIINISFGTNVSSQIIKLRLKKAAAAGVLIVAASGNGDYKGVGVDNNLKPTFPASYKLSNILSVGAVKPNGSLTRYSNYGRTEVDITAIGGHVDFFEKGASLLNSAYVTNPSNILTQPMVGTSMATAIVSGIAALLLAQDPSLTPTEIKEVIMSTGTNIPSLRGLILSESTIDAQKAILSL